ncbi:MAG: hypothetical protein WD825_15735 [Gemmatimonadaceae bacterium]
MARVYSAKLVALTVGVQPKWLDNLLSHHDLPGVSRSRQGLERSINDDGVLAIEVVRALVSELEVPIAKAVSIAQAALAARSPSEMRFVVEPSVSVLFAVLEIEHRLRERIIEAVEAVAHVPRGRPRRPSPQAVSKKNAE